MTDLSRFQTKSGKVFRHGREIEIKTIVSTTKSKPKRQFEVEFVQVPNYWIEQLAQARYLATYKLALRILREAFKQQYWGSGEIVLSTDATGLPRATRWSAIKELVELKLIQIEQSGNQAVRVTKLAHVKWVGRKVIVGGARS